MSDTSAGRDEYRLTSYDEDRIRERIVENIREREACGMSAATQRGSAEVKVSMLRSAAHSVGCSMFDLRESELVWIEQEVVSALTSRQG